MRRIGICQVVDIGEVGAVVHAAVEHGILVLFHQETPLCIFRGDELHFFYVTKISVAAGEGQPVRENQQVSKVQEILSPRPRYCVKLTCYRSP